MQHAVDLPTFDLRKISRREVRTRTEKLTLQSLIEVLLRTSHCFHLRIREQGSQYCEKEKYRFSLLMFGDVSS